MYKYEDVASWRIETKNSQLVRWAFIRERVDIDGLTANGTKFVYIKASEGLRESPCRLNLLSVPGQRNPEFLRGYIGARDAGLIRGAYHSPRPGLGDSNARLQVEDFLIHGGR